MAPARTENGFYGQAVERLLSREPRSRKFVRLALCVIAFLSALLFLFLHDPAHFREADRMTAVVFLFAVGSGSIWFATASAQRPDPIVSESFLTFARFRPAALTVTMLSFAGAAGLLDKSPMGASGDTVLGYVLGTLSALIMLWLAFFRVRKESYFSRGLSLRAWLAFHVYLGLALLLLVPMHAGFRFGWNVHTASFVVTVGAVITGLLGVVLYVRIPRLVTLNRKGATLETMIEQIATLDSDAKSLAASLPDLSARAVLDSVVKTRIGGEWWERLLGVRSTRAVSEALETVSSPEVVLELEDAKREQLHAVVEVLAEKFRLLNQIDRDLRYQTWLVAWLYLHVPLAFGAVAAVAIHVVLVLYY